MIIYTQTPTQAHLRLFIVSLRDLIVGDVDEAHLPLLLLQLGVEDLKTEQIGLPALAAARRCQSEKCPHIKTHFRSALECLCPHIPSSQRQATGGTSCHCLHNH